MNKITAQQLLDWGQPPAAQRMLTEDEQKRNTSDMVKEKVKPRVAELTDRKIDVYQQGSFQRNTHIKGDSDVDMAVCANVFTFDLPPSLAAPPSIYDNTIKQFNINLIQFNHADLRTALRTSVREVFSEFTEGKKSFDITENTYHSKGDVVGLFQYRLYDTTGGYREGVCLRLNGTGPLVINWPNENSYWADYMNEKTNNLYRQVVRTIKSVKRELKYRHPNISGFYLEGLLASLQPSMYSGYDYAGIIRRIVLEIKNKVAADVNHQLLELNHVKPLFKEESERLAMISFLNDVELVIP